MTPDFGWLFLKMIAGLVLVLILAVVSIRLLPRLTGARRLGFWKGGSSPQWIKVIEKFPLEPKKNLYLVKVVGRYFVMATSEQGVVPVTELNAGEGEKIEGKS